VFGLSVDHIIASGITFAFSSVVTTICWCWRERRRCKSRLAIMDKRVENQLLLERERRKRPPRRLDHPRPPPPFR
jgi:hypothetical protein